MQKMYSVLTLITIISTLLSCLLGLYFINDRNITDKLFYGMAPMIVFFTLGLIFAGMILWYYSKRMEVAKDNDGRRIMRGTAILMGLFPGCFLVVKIIYPILQITYFGPWNALTGLTIGFIYIRIGAWLIKKPMDYIIAI